MEIFYRLISPFYQLNHMGKFFLKFLSQFFSNQFLLTITSTKNLTRYKRIILLFHFIKNHLSNFIIFI